MHEEPGSSFLSVAQTARRLGTSEMTVRRAIQGGQFPAVRVRGRLVVPERVLDELADAAMAGGRLVDAADWALPAR